MTKFEIRMTKYVPMTNFQFGGWGLIIISMLVIGFSSLTSPAYASLDPMRLGGGARSLGMGRTNMALIGDVSSMFINPANAAYLPNWGFTSMRVSLLEGDINYTLLGFGRNLGNTTVGVAYLGGGTSGITGTSRDTNNRIVNSGSSFDYASSVMSFVYGKEISRKMAWGMGLKLFNKSFSSQTGGGGSGFGLDVGLIYRPKRNVYVGIAQQNLLLPGLGGSIDWGTGLKEQIPANTRFGVAFNPRKKVLLTFDYDTQAALRGGLELNVRENLDLRAGFEQVACSAGGKTLNYTLGLGFKLKGCQIDYAYYIDNVLSANSTAYISLSFIADKWNDYSY